MTVFAAASVFLVFRHFFFFLSLSLSLFLSLFVSLFLCFFVCAFLSFFLYSFLYSFLTFFLPSFFFFLSFSLSFVLSFSLSFPSSSPSSFFFFSCVVVPFLSLSGATTCSSTLYLPVYSSQQVWVFFSLFLAFASNSSLVFVCPFVVGRLLSSWLLSFSLFVYPAVPQGGFLPFFSFPAFFMDSFNCFFFFLVADPA
jgi:hypothetical protein